MISLNFTKTGFVFLVILTTVFSCQNEMPIADLIVINGNIWTGNTTQNSAQALAIQGDSIIAVGTNEDVQKYIGSATLVEDAQGKFITPGFIDTHVHLISGGNSLLSVDLRDAKTKGEFARRIGDFAKTLEPGAWILEGNWDHTLWGGELPKKEWIDELTKNNPIFISRLDGHMVLANSVALEFAGIDKNTKEVAGGEIVRYDDGTPTGVLKDNAMNLLTDKIPPLTALQKENAFNAAMKYFASNGVTSVHDVNGLDNNFGSFEEAKKTIAKSEARVRIYAIKPLSHWDELAKMEKNNTSWLKIGGLKGFVDGSLGSHTAAFNEPYTDKPSDKGFFINSKDDLYNWISGADKADLQVLVHAIGDSAIHSLLDIYDQVIKENGVKDRRLRIEHAQHISPDDISRFAQLGVIASMQPYHAIDDGRWAEELIGAERIKTTYAFKSLLDANATVVFGSDWAVAPAAPILGIYAAVTRRTLDEQNPDGWVAEQKITVEQALSAYTKNAAFASFDENIKGTLELGKMADFVIFNQDLIKIDASKIKDAKVMQTYIGGKKVYDINEN